jgi:hypothetical protein
MSAARINQPNADHGLPLHKNYALAANVFVSHLLKKVILVRLELGALILFVQVRVRKVAP